MYRYRQRPKNIRMNKGTGRSVKSWQFAVLVTIAVVAAIIRNVTFQGLPGKWKFKYFEKISNFGTCAYATCKNFFFFLDERYHLLS